MPALKNQRHERFARFLAEGFGPSQAYAKAGFENKEPKSGAHQLMKNNPTIQTRLDELNREAQALSSITVATQAVKLKQLSKKLEDDADYKGAVQAEKAVNDLLGLNGSHKVELTGASGGPVEVENAFATVTIDALREALEAQGFEPDDA